MPTGSAPFSGLSDTATGKRWVGHIAKAAMDEGQRAERATGKSAVGSGSDAAAPKVAEQPSQARVPAAQADAARVSDKPSKEDLPNQGAYKPEAAAQDHSKQDHPTTDLSKYGLSKVDPSKPKPSKQEEDCEPGHDKDHGKEHGKDHGEGHGEGPKQDHHQGQHSDEDQHQGQKQDVNVTVVVDGDVKAGKHVHHAEGKESDEEGSESHEAKAAHHGKEHKKHHADPSHESAKELAHTGVDELPLILGATALIGTGGALHLLGRRRRA